MHKRGGGAPKGQLRHFATPQGPVDEAVLVRWGDGAGCCGPSALRPTQPTKKSLDPLFGLGNIKLYCALR